MTIKTAVFEVFLFVIQFEVDFYQVSHKLQIKAVLKAIHTSDAKLGCFEAILWQVSHKLQIRVV